MAQSKLWPKGTICITIAANIAETGILGFDACFPDSVIGIVVNDEITTNEYVEYLLQAVKARIKAKGQGSAQDNINLGTFENERFPFPDLVKQNEIVDILNSLSSEIQRLESIYQQNLPSLPNSNNPSSKRPLPVNSPPCPTKLLKRQSHEYWQ